MMDFKSLERYKEIIFAPCFLFIMVFAAVYTETIIIRPVYAQPLDFTKNFTVFLTLFGLNNTTGQIFVFVKAHDLIKDALVNGTHLFIANNQTGGVPQVPVEFQNLNLKVGEQYTACIVVLKQTKMICMSDFKTPYPRPQILDISVQ